jgi:hypothetical protein
MLYNLRLLHDGDDYSWSLTWLKKDRIQGKKKKREPKKRVLFPPIQYRDTKNIFLCVTCNALFSQLGMTASLPTQEAIKEYKKQFNSRVFGFCTRRDSVVCYFYS